MPHHMLNGAMSRYGASTVRTGYLKEEIFSKITGKQRKFIKKNFERKILKEFKG